MKLKPYNTGITIVTKISVRNKTANTSGGVGEYPSGFIHGTFE